MAMTRAGKRDHAKVTDNKFHRGAKDGRHYWLTPAELYSRLDAEFGFDYDPCPYPKPEDYNGLEADWGASSYVNPPFGSFLQDGKKLGVTAWVRKAIAEHRKGKRVVLVFPVDKWVLMLLAAGAQVRNLGDVHWLATEDGLPGKGTGRHIACFVLEPDSVSVAPTAAPKEPIALRARAKSQPRELQPVLWSAMAEQTVA